MNETMFDFEDGNGPVPAHKHPNGDGWVADTASVEDTFFVGHRTRVYGNARLEGTGNLFDDAQVFGNAYISGRNPTICGTSKIYGNAKIKDEAFIRDSIWIAGNVTVQGSSILQGGVRLFNDWVIGDSGNYKNYKPLINGYFTVNEDGTISQNE